MFDVEIEPCPFCGNDDPQWNADNAETVLWLDCPECGATGPTAQTHEEAADLWNQRM
jgi:Lar family restriction alleviation protein